MAHTAHSADHAMPAGPVGWIGAAGSSGLRSGATGARDGRGASMTVQTFWRPAGAPSCLATSSWSDHNDATWAGGWLTGTLRMGTHPAGRDSRFITYTLRGGREFITTPYVNQGTDHFVCGPLDNSSTAGSSASSSSGSN